MRKFTQEEDDFLRNNYLTIPAVRISKMLKRSKVAAAQRMKLLGIVVPPEIIEKFKKQSQFKTGQTPLNKGKKMPAHIYEKCKNTMFKKGQLPHNTASANGEIRIRTHRRSGIRYKYMRVSIAKWELYHRIIWQEANGPIPEEMLIVFKDGDTMNCSIENLEMITMQENMKRNTIQRFPQELKEVIFLQNKINRKVHEHNNSRRTQGATRSVE